MSVIIRLQNLPWSANAAEIRRFFKGLTIPDGGVHIVGGEDGDAFIAFATDEDARQAMLHTGEQINGVGVKLFLSSRTQMQNVISVARGQGPADTATQVQPAVVAQTPAVAQSQAQTYQSQQLYPEASTISHWDTAAYGQDSLSYAAPAITGVSASNASHLDANAVYQEPAPVASTSIPVYSEPDPKTSFATGDVKSAFSTQETSNRFITAMAALPALQNIGNLSGLSSAIESVKQMGSAAAAKGLANKPPTSQPSAYKDQYDAMDYSSPSDPYSHYPAAHAPATGTREPDLRRDAARYDSTATLQSETYRDDMRPKTQYSDDMRPQPLYKDDLRSSTKESRDPRLREDPRLPPRNNDPRLAPAARHEDPRLPPRNDDPRLAPIARDEDPRLPPRSDDPRLQPVARGEDPRLPPPPPLIDDPRLQPVARGEDPRLLPRSDDPRLLPVSRGEDPRLLPIGRGDDPRLPPDVRGEDPRLPPVSRRSDDPRLPPVSRNDIRPSLRYSDDMRPQPAPPEIGHRQPPRDTLNKDPRDPRMRDTGPRTVYSKRWDDPSRERRNSPDESLSYPPMDIDEGYSHPRRKDPTEYPPYENEMDISREFDKPLIGDRPPVSKPSIADRSPVSAFDRDIRDSGPKRDYGVGRAQDQDNRPPYDRPPFGQFGRGRGGPGGFGNDRPPFTHEGDRHGAPPFGRGPPPINRDPRGPPFRGPRPDGNRPDGLSFNGGPRMPMRGPPPRDQMGRGRGMGRGGPPGPNEWNNGLRQTGPGPIGQPMDEDRGRKRPHPVDNSRSICVTNMPLTISYRECRRFFSGIDIPHDGVKLINDDFGMRNGFGYVQFAKAQDAAEACKFHGRRWGDKCAEIRRCLDQEFEEAIDSKLPDREPKEEKPRNPPLEIPRSLLPETIPIPVPIPVKKVPEIIAASSPKRARSRSPSFSRRDRDRSDRDRSERDRDRDRDLKDRDSRRDRDRDRDRDRNRDRDRDRDRRTSREKDRERDKDRDRRDRDRDRKDKDKDKDKEKDRHTSRSLTPRDSDKEKSSRDKDRKKEKEEKKEEKKQVEEEKFTDRCLSLKGLPPKTEVDDILTFFKGLALIPNSVYIEYDLEGKAIGPAYMEFSEMKDFKTALTYSDRHIDGKVIEVKPMTRKMIETRVKEHKNFLNKSGEEQKLKEEKEKEKGSAQNGERESREKKDNDRDRDNRPLQTERARDNEVDRRPPLANGPRPSDDRKPPSLVDDRKPPPLMDERRPPPLMDDRRPPPFGDRRPPLLEDPPREMRRKDNISDRGGFSNGNDRDQRGRPLPFERTRSPGDYDQGPQQPPPSRETFCVHLVGLPYSAGVDEIVEFFEGIRIAPNGIHIILKEDGMPTGCAYVEFATPIDQERALAKHREYMGNRFIQIRPVSQHEVIDVLRNDRGPPPKDHGPGFHHEDSFDRGMGEMHHKPTTGLVRKSFPLPKGYIGRPQCIVGISRLPYTVTPDEILDRLGGYRPIRESVRIRMTPAGKTTGDCIIAFHTPMDAERAATELNGTIIGRKPVSMYVHTPGVP